LIAELLRRYPRTWLSVSATTRRPRPGEREGVEYFFMDEEEFARKADAGGFLEWAEVHGRRYGTPRHRVMEKMDEGCDVILEIDVQGAEQVRERMPDAVTVFVEPPSLEELERRLRERGTESEEELRERLANARLESREAAKFDYVVVNDELPRAVDELCAIYERESPLCGGG